MGDPGPPDRSAGRPGAGPEFIGSRVREERLSQKIGVRELARRVGVSASLISQVELGKASPSVGTLYGIVSALGLSLDELFAGGTSEPSPGGKGSSPAEAAGARETLEPATEPRPVFKAVEGPAVALVEQLPTGSGGPVVRQDGRQAVQLATGVRWELLTPHTRQDVDFLYVTYAPGSESCPHDSLMRHDGREYGHVVAGRLGVTIGFETYELQAGDSVAFESSMPHRLFCVGNEEARAIWFVVGRRGDARLTEGH